MAVALRVLVQVVLVIVFRAVEILQRSHLNDNRRFRLALNLVEDTADLGQISGIGVIDACAIAGSFVFSLLVERGRVDGLEEHPEQEPESDPFRVVLDVYGFGIARRVGVDFLVGGIRRMAVGKSDLCQDNAVDLLEEMLGAPKTAAGQINILSHRY